MELLNNFTYSSSDTAILQQLGAFVKQTRLQQNKTQEAVAAAAGINRSTLVQLEKGNGGTMLSFVQVLRALEKLNVLQHFQVKQQISPLQLAKLQQQQRKRSSSKYNASSPTTKTDW